MIETEIKSGVRVKRELEEIVKDFKETGDEKYFNELWDGVKAFAIMLIKKYENVAFEDKLIVAMECLWDCCGGRNEKTAVKEGKNILTYYGNILNRRLCDEFQKKLNAQKNKINETALSLEELQEDQYYQPKANIDDFSISLFMDDCKLYGIEVTLVALINEGYTKTEILKRLKLRSEEYNQLLETIKSKIRSNYLETEGFSL